MFISCSHVSNFLSCLQACCFDLHPHPFQVKEILLGECYGLDIPLWNRWRGSYLWHCWIQRNEALFRGASSNGSYILHFDLKRIALHCTRQMKDVIDGNLTYIQRFSPWQQWAKKMLALYSRERLIMKDRCLML